jgi:hypothetical protein
VASPALLVPGEPAAEPLVYRPFALLALAATVAGGTPIGLWLLWWLYLGGPAVPAQWLLLHASLQSLGFFGSLIPGVAPHLFARFTGQPLRERAWTRWIFALLLAGLLVRVAGTWLGSPGWVLSATLAQAGAFLVFAWQTWRALDAPALGLLRRHLTASTAWLAAACLAEAGLRWSALRDGLLLPDLGGMRAVHAMALLGGAVGWVTGVLLRAGPMFAAGWRLPEPTARAVLPVLAAGVAVTIAGESGAWPPRTGPAFARLGEFMALSGAAALLLRGGALARAPRGLPMLGQGPGETRLFRLAVLSLAAAAAGSALTTALAAAGAPAHLLSDAVRHLLTVGFLAGVVIAMVERLVPVLERRALPWPGLRAVAFWALLGSVVLRSLEILIPYLGRPAAALAAASGPLAWIALAGLAANVVGAMAAARR